MLVVKIANLYCIYKSHIYADKLAQRQVMPGTIGGCYTSLKHREISIFNTPKAKSEIPEHMKWKEEHINI